jgi:DDE superfamily endonuclease
LALGERAASVARLVRHMVTSGCTTTASCGKTHGFSIAGDAGAEVSTFDEHRVGLKPIIRRVYAPRGEQPMVRVHPRYEWLYLYAFVHPNSGRSVWYLLPALNTAAFQAVLENFALEVLSEAGKRVLVVLDNAAWHKSKTLEIPSWLAFVFLPSNLLELQPAERLWALFDAPIANRCLPGLVALETVLFAQCAALAGDAGRVRAFTRFGGKHLMFTVQHDQSIAL